MPPSDLIWLLLQEDWLGACKAGGEEVGASPQPSVSGQQIYWCIYWHWALGDLASMRRHAAPQRAPQPDACGYPPSVGRGENKRCSARSHLLMSLKSRLKAFLEPQVLQPWLDHKWGDPWKALDGSSAASSAVPTSTLLLFCSDLNVTRTYPTFRVHTIFYAVCLTITEWSCSWQNLM